MGFCWYCYWGWAVPVRDIYDEFVAKTSPEAMHFGPAHIVWEDENFEDGNIDFCIQACDEGKYQTNLTAEQVALVRESLVRLRAIPLEVRCCCPEDYDDENPDNYPPKIPVRK